MPAQIRKQTKPRIPPLTLEHARIIYRNFAGKAKTYNAAGLRNFHVVLDPEDAKRLQADGWNIKWPKPRDDGEERNPTLKVAVRFDNFPPHVVMMTKKNRVELDEESIGQLDTAQIEDVALRITGSYYKMDNGQEGFKAYLSQLFVILSENDLMAKYSAYPSDRDSEDAQ